MASTVNNASATSTTTPSTAAGTSPAQKDGTTRLVKQSNTTTKMNDKGRRESPSGRGPAPKAWSGPNPITQRASTPNQSNGNLSQGRLTPTKGVTGREKEFSHAHSHDRLQFVFGATTGLPVVLTTKAGDKFEGILAGVATLPNNGRVVLKMTKRIQSSPITQPNGTSSREAAFTGSSPNHTMSFELRDMADMAIPEFSLPEPVRHTNGALSSFQTDTDISGNSLRGERTLQRWIPDSHTSNDFSFEVNHTGNWDQFATHQRMTGGQSTYNEEIYTTTINRNAPDFSRREAEAARLAREIEAETSTNAHIREERGQAFEAENEDEEDKYSGVKRSNGAFPPVAAPGGNRYTSPALRTQKSQPAADGLPLDPAILSAQPARPGFIRTSNSNNAASMKTNDTPGKSTLDNQNLTSAALTKDTDVNAAAWSSTTSNAANTTLLADAQSTTSTSASPQVSTSVVNPSDRVEDKLLLQFRKFADIERARVAEKKRVQASHDRTAKINDLVRFSKTFKLKTPVPDDLVGILAKDPKKQEVIIQKAKQDSEVAKVSAPIQAATAIDEPQPIPKFDRSQIPPAIPIDKGAFQAQRALYGKQSLPRNTRPPVLHPGFPGPSVPVAPRGQSATMRDRTAAFAHIPTTLPLPEMKGAQNVAEKSGLSSPRGSDTPTSAVSSKFNVRATEFKPTAPSFNPSGAAAAASPSPTARRISIARVATPSSFFGLKKPLPAAERLDVSKAFNPIPRIKKEVEAEKNTKGDKPTPDYAWNGGLRPAYDSPVTWTVPDINQAITYEDHFKRQIPTISPPVQSRSSSNNTMTYPGQIPNLSAGHMPPTMTPQHVHTMLPHYQQQFEEQRLHNMQNGLPSTYASPSMTPRNVYITPMIPPAQISYGQPGYFGNVTQHMRGYGGTPSMPHMTPAQMTAPLMAPQHSGGPYMNMQQQFGYGSPSSGHIYPANGYPSPGRVAPMMMHQGSQQGHPAAQQMMYGMTPAGQMFGQQHGRGSYASGMTPYGTSPHQAHHMGPRTMSTGYGKMSQMGAGTGPPVNAPQQPASFGQVPEEPK